MLPRDQQTTEHFFNTAAFAVQPFGTFGNVGRNTLIGPRLLNWDFSAHKNFNFTETRRLQFRYEAFNLWNNTNYNRPGNSVSAPATFGRITAAQPARVMQMALKLYF